jgi:hypothetical protein
MLVKQTLKLAIQEALTPQMPPGESLSQQEIASISQMADKLANAIDAYIRSGTVTHAPGTVTGTTPGGGQPLVAGAAVDGVIS